MTDLNPLAGAILGSAQAQQLIDVEKQRQVRRAQALSKNVAVQDDQLEHQVESSEELSPIHDEEREHSQNGGQHSRRHPDPDDDRSHIDVKG